MRRVTEDTPTGRAAEPARQEAPAPGAPASDRRERLKSVYARARACERCAQLVGARTQVVFGAGNADADLMLVAESPSAREDEQGSPLTGATGRLMEDLLRSAGIEPEQVFATHLLKCRPPGNRDPSKAELARCRDHLADQVRLIEPRVICTLGDFATRTLTGRADGIRVLHGRPTTATVGGRAVHLVPLFHPAAALYTRALLEGLRADVVRLPELLARPLPEQPVREPEPEPAEPEADETTTPEPEPEPVVEPEPERRPEPPQLGLF